MLKDQILSFCTSVGTDIKALFSRSISAGNGLSGGGDLSANRTITLGTPGSLTDITTNAVTTTSHTHSVATASSVARGLVQLATNAETIAGTNAVKAVTPAALQAYINQSGPTISAAFLGTLHGTKMAWRKANANSYVQFVATKTWTDATAIIVHNIYLVASDTQCNLRLALYNAAGTTRISVGAGELTIQARTVGEWYATPVEDMFSGLVVGTTYRIYLECFEETPIGGWDFQYTSVIKAK